LASGLLLFATGCDYLFQLDHVGPDGGNAAPQDGTIDDSGKLSEQPEFCQTPVIFDAFDMPAAICPWGAKDNAGQSVHDSVLDMQLDGTQATFSGCTAYNPLPFTAAGVFLVVPKLLVVPSGYTKLGVRESTNTSPTLNVAIAFDGVAIRFFVNDAPVGQAMTTLYTWWRLDQETPGVVAADVSNDGIHWTNLGTTTQTLPPAINVDIGAGNTGVTVAGSAQFATFGVCD
jgi:hypothetical protein